MPITSDQVSSLIASNNQQMMQSMQYASSIGQHGGRSQGEGLMSSATNIGASVGGPMAMGAMAIAGLDPMSAGIRGGMAGFGAAGVAGGAMGALGAAAGVGVPLMALQYGGQQMLQGMQQQQQLNSTLRQNYSFMGQTGRGFSQGEMGSIGQMMRTNAGQIGAGGEITGFNELAQLAANMSRLGGAQNIRTARDFTEKFQQMLKTVKEVATSMSTSLEQAQEVMGAMRGSGIFGGQGAVAGQIRSTALAGGLATSEVTSMMGVGSQISRMVGGLGRAGAMGGMRAIGQVGQAQQAGLITEEDIYNATGQTGAEGRQSMAMQGMQRSAAFLKGGLGRRMLASMAQRDGGIDEGVASQYEGGSMGTEGTRGQWGSHLAKTGRANFILNEGRMRGAALEKFGGLADVAVMKSWLDQRGMGDERQKIFMMRRLGVGRDELDTSLKMLENLPQMEAQQRGSAEDAEWQKKLDLQRSKMGISGLKKKFDHARNEVQNTLQQAGAQFYQDGANFLERWINTMTGDYVKSVDRDIGQLTRQFWSGSMSQGMQQRLGMGKGPLGGVDQVFTKGASAAMFGGGQASTLTTYQTSGDVGRLKDAGYRFKATTDEGAIKEFARAKGLSGAFQEGAEGSQDTDIGMAARSALQRAVRTGALTGSGEQALAKFGHALQTSSDPLLRKYYETTYSKAKTPEARMRMMGDVYRGAGLSELGTAQTGLPDFQAVLGMGGARTEEDRVALIGKYSLGKTARERPKGFDWAAAFDNMGSGMVGSSGMVGGVGKEPLRAFTEGQEKTYGRFISGEQGQQWLSGALSGDAKMRERTENEMSARASALLVSAKGDPNKLPDEQRAEFEGIRSIEMAQAYSKYYEENKKAPEGEDLARLARQTKATGGEDFLARAVGTLAVGARKQDERRAEFYRRTADIGTKNIEAYRAAGIIQGKGMLSDAAAGMLSGVGKLTVVTDKKLLRAAGLTQDAIDAGINTRSTGQLVLAQMVRVAQAQSEIVGSPESGAADKLKMDEAMSGSKGIDTLLAGASTAEKRSMAAELRKGGGAAVAGMVQRLETEANIQSKLDRYRGKGRIGEDIILGKTLGVSLSPKELREMSKMTVDETAKTLSTRLGIRAGIGGEDFQERLKEAVGDLRAGKTGAAAQGLAGLQGDPEIIKARLAENEAKARTDPSYVKLGEIASNTRATTEAILNLKGGTYTAPVSGEPPMEGTGRRLKPGDKGYE